MTDILKTSSALKVWCSNEFECLVLLMLILQNILHVRYVYWKGWDMWDWTENFSASKGDDSYGPSGGNNGIQMPYD